jgi:glycine hydroxymethyltransferase
MTATLTDVRPQGFFTGTLAERDPEITGWINKELQRQRDKIELIASKTSARPPCWKPPVRS